MAYDPYYAKGPSDSGLLDDALSEYGAPSTSTPSGSVPSRDEYVAPEPGVVDASAPEESLREVPLPEGFLTRLRGVVDDLG